MPLVPQIVDAVGDRVPVVAAGGIFDGRGLAAAHRARRRRRVARHALHRDARGAHRRAATRTRCCARPRTAPSISRGFTGKTLRAVRNEWTQYIEEHPEELSKFPEQMVHGDRRPTRCTSAATRTPTSTPTASATRRARASARSHELVPAGDLVRRIVDEAEHALGPRRRRPS